MEKNSFDIVCEYLTPESFYSEKHQIVFETIWEMRQNLIAVDVLTVVEYLTQKQKLEEVGGPFFITNLTTKVASSAHLDEWCKIVQEKFLLRSLAAISGVIYNDCYSPQTDVFDLMDETQTKIFNLSTINIKEQYSAADDISISVIADLEKQMRRKTFLTGVPSGYSTIDYETAGWQKTDLIILAARPSVGKSMFAINLAVNAALSGNPVGVFSLEMSKEQIMQRVMSNLTDFPLEKIRTGQMMADEFSQFINRWNTNHKIPIYIDDTGGMSLFELRAKARRMVQRHKVQIIIVDYLQLLTDRQKGQSREQEVSAVARALKAMAKDLRVPVIALSQLSRNIEQRKGGEPQLSDLRESGAIEQDADIVAFIVRPDYQEIGGEEKEEVSILFKKHRQGALFSTTLKTNLGLQKVYEETPF